MKILLLKIEIFLGITQNTNKIQGKPWQMGCTGWLYDTLYNSFYTSTSVIARICTFFEQNSFKTIPSKHNSTNWSKGR